MWGGWRGLPKFLKTTQSYNQENEKKTNEWQRYLQIIYLVYRLYKETS